MKRGLMKKYVLTGKYSYIGGSNEGALVINPVNTQFFAKDDEDARKKLKRDFNFRFVTDKCLWRLVPVKLKWFIFIPTTL